VVMRCWFSCFLFLSFLFRCRWPLERAPSSFRFFSFFFFPPSVSALSLTVKTEFVVSSSHRFEKTPSPRQAVKGRGSGKESVRKGKGRRERAQLTPRKEEDHHRERRRQFFSVDAAPALPSKKTKTRRRNNQPARRGFPLTQTTSPHSPCRDRARFLSQAIRGRKKERLEEGGGARPP